MNLTVPVDLSEGDYALNFGLIPADAANADAPVDHPTVQAATLRVRPAP
jgi:hypothetical protein